MCRNTLFGYELGIGLRADDRAPWAGFVRGWGALFAWRERVRQRRELATMSERDLADLGIPLGLAVYEAGRWPWQKISPVWRLLGYAHCEISPIDPFSSPLRRDRERTSSFADAAPTRERV